MLSSRCRPPAPPPQSHSPSAKRPRGGVNIVMIRVSIVTSVIICISIVISVIIIIIIVTIYYYFCYEYFCYYSSSSSSYYYYYYCYDCPVAEPSPSGKRRRAGALRKSEAPKAGVSEGMTLATCLAGSRDYLGLLSGKIGGRGSGDGDKH